MCMWVCMRVYKERERFKNAYHARRSKQSILKEISPGCSLEGLMLQLKLQYIGHLVGRTDSLEKTLMLGKIEGGKKKGMTEDEVAGWHHRLNGHESEWTPGVGDGQGGLACCDSWDRKESDTTERPNWTELTWSFSSPAPDCLGVFWGFLFCCQSLRSWCSWGLLLWLPLLLQILSSSDVTIPKTVYQQLVAEAHVFYSRSYLPSEFQPSLSTSQLEISAAPHEPLKLSRWELGSPSFSLNLLPHLCSLLLEIVAKLTPTHPSWTRGHRDCIFSLVHLSPVFPFWSSSSLSISLLSQHKTPICHWHYHITHALLLSF